MDSLIKQLREAKPPHKPLLDMAADRILELEKLADSDIPNKIWIDDCGRWSEEFTFPTDELFVRASRVDKLEEVYRLTHKMLSTEDGYLTDSEGKLIDKLLAELE